MQLVNNEMVKERYGDDAYQNEIPDTKTSLYEFLPTEISIEYVKNIKSLTEFYLLVKAKKWGNIKGCKRHFKSVLRIEHLEEYKNKAIELLNKEKEGIDTKTKLHGYIGVSIICDKFLAYHKGERFTFDHVEDAAKKYNELVIKYKPNVTKLELNNDIPNTKTTVHQLTPLVTTREDIEKIKHLYELKQVVKKKNWHGGKPFKIKSMTMKTFEDDKKKAIELLEAEQIQD